MKKSVRSSTFEGRQYLTSIRHRAIDFPAFSLLANFMGVGRIKIVGQSPRFLGVEISAFLNIRVKNMKFTTACKITSWDTLLKYDKIIKIGANFISGISDT